MIIVKCTSTGSTNWSTWHRGAGGTLWLNSINADSANGGGQATSGIVYNPGSNTSAFTVDGGANVNQSGRTYVAYIFAHHDGDGEFGPDSDQDVIECGSYTGNGNSNGTEVNLGFEPQWLLIKCTSHTGSWQLVDAIRGVASYGNDKSLRTDATNTESTANYFRFTPTGFALESTKQYSKR